MIKNYLLSAWRFALRQRLHTAINILGLTLGMAAALLILQYVNFETSYNKFHSNYKDIYRISYSKEKGGVESFNTVLTYAGTGKLMKEQFPEVLDFVRLRPASVITSTTVLGYDDQFFEESNIYYTDPSFFDIFSFPLLIGDPKTALKEQFTAVITEALAKKYFGEEDPIGKTIKKGQRETYVITGVMKALPPNSHFQANCLLSHASLSVTMPEFWTQDDLNVFNGHLYLLTKPGTDPLALKAKFPQFVDDFVGGKELAEQDIVLKYHIMPLEDIHLHSDIQHEAEMNGDDSVILYLSIIGILILAIAVFNYINLSTARAMDRAREIGIRKVSGASKKSLIGQFLIEALMVNFFAILFAILLVEVAQNFLWDLGAEKLKHINLFKASWFWASCGLLLAISTLFSGFYPAMVLASFKPVNVLKGKIRNQKNGRFFRKTLVIFQFASSIALIIATLVIYNQITFMRTQKLGMNIDDTLVVKGPRSADSTYVQQYTAFRQTLLEAPAIKNISATHSIPGQEYQSATWFRRGDMPDLDARFCYINHVDDNFLLNYEISLVAGRNFLGNDSSDRNSILINQTTAALFGFESDEDAIGKIISPNVGEGQEAPQNRVIGVMEDFHQESLKKNYSPVLIFRRPYIRGFFSLKLDRSTQQLGNLPETLASIETAWNTAFPAQPFNYFFLKDSFDKQYKGEISFGKLLTIFSLLALIVGIMGLLGLSTFTIQQRTKEIGIRKVLGASIPNIAFLLSKELIGLIIVSNIIAWPICWYLLEDWLTGFSFRIDLTVWPFLISFVGILLIAILVISYQVTKAALTNPIRELRYE